MKWMPGVASTKPVIDRQELPNDTVSVLIMTQFLDRVIQSPQHCGLNIVDESTNNNTQAHGGDR